MAESLVCAGCALYCDDVSAELAGVESTLAPDCRLGEAWLRALSGGPSTAGALHHGAPIALSDAVGLVSARLRAARRPLLAGFAEATVEDARAAVALADRLGALVCVGPPSAVGSSTGAAGAVALRGASTATLGEIRDRTELLVIWREDPETTHPRLLQRLGDRATLAVVGDRDTATARRAELRIELPAGDDLSALTGLAVGVELAGLLARIRAADHVTFVHGPALSGGSGGERRLLALQALVRSLGDTPHVVTLALPRGAGTRSADDVLTWQTGYPAAVDFASGHPEPVTAPLSDTGVDVVVQFSGPELSAPDGAAVIALTPLPVPGAELWIGTAAPGREAGGTVHRLDGVPLTLAALLSRAGAGGPPSAAAVLSMLAAELGA